MCNPKNLGWHAPELQCSMLFFNSLQDLNVPFFEVSAKTGENVEEAFKSLAELLLREKFEKFREADDGHRKERIDVEDHPEQNDIGHGNERIRLELQPEQNREPNRRRNEGGCCN